ncbi:MAG TPA: response regulator [Bacilli bacterium]
MFKALIIDDEEPSREAIQLLGDWKRLGVTEIFEASNGKEGIELLRKQKCEIVLVDMKMPEMDGREFLRRVEKEHLETLIIIISGYRDFAYARQAIQAKAHDYILKPVNRRELNRVLETAVQQLREKKLQENESVARNIALNMSLPKMKEKIYISLIERSVKQLGSDYLQLIGANGKNKKFNIVLFRMMNKQKVLADKFMGDVESLHFAVSNVLCELGSGMRTFCFINPKQAREVVAVLTFELLTIDQVRFASKDFAMRAANKMKQLFGMATAAGVGNGCGDIFRLHDPYMFAENALMAVNLLAGKHGEMQVKRTLEPETGLLKSALEAGDCGYAKSVVHNFLGKIKDTGYFSIGDALNILDELKRLLQDTAQQFGLSAEDCPRDVTVDFSNFANYEALMLRMLDDGCRRIGNVASAGSRFSVHEIKAYIDNFYFRDIKISMFTKKYHLSREYLMKLFKQEFGLGIHEYVQKIRMEKAAELLENPELKIHNIAGMLGYKDNNYFSKAFKNYYSVSPTEYRQKHGQIHFFTPN